MDNSGSPSDFATKYQKLATEYSKLRTHTSVLKKAVSDEQSKNTDLKELLKEKDQIARKLEQEIECLNFRNMQLTKRVGVLQEDLLTVSDDKTKNRKVKGQASPKVEDKSILDEELLNRIEENEKLHQQVYNTEMEQRKLVEDLSKELIQLKAEAAQQEATWNENLNAREQTIQKLAEERAKIEIRIRNLEKELMECKEQETICREDLDKVETELGQKLSSVLVIVEDKLPFVDSRNSKLMSLEPPVFVSHYWKDVISYLSTFGLNLTELLRKLSDLHMYMEQQMRNFLKSGLSSKLQSHVLSKFIEYLHEHPSYLKEIERAFHNFQSRQQTNSTLLWSDAFKSTFLVSCVSRYVSYLEKLLPYILISLQMKRQMAENIPRLSDSLRSLEKLTVQIVRVFARVERWLLLLTNYTYLLTDGRITDSLNYVFEKLIASVQFLLETFDEVRKQFSLKIAVEHELPTVDTATKNTDECLLSCLVSIVNILHKLLSDLPKENIFNPKKLFGPLRKTASVNGAVTGFRIRAKKYITNLDEEPPKEVPYCLAIKNQESIKYFTENQDLIRHQLHALETKVTKLEQEKEHWMLECQLLQTKQKREMKFEANKDEVNESDLETCVREHIQTLVIKLQLADTKALAFQSECTAIYQKLKITEEQCAIYVKELADAKNSISELKTKLESTINGYEDQLSSMTEHLSIMNDKLTTQKEEIDSLRHSNVKKSKSK